MYYPNDQKFANISKLPRALPPALQQNVAPGTDQDPLTLDTTPSEDSSPSCGVVNTIRHVQLL